MTTPPSLPTKLTPHKLLPFILLLTSLGLGILSNYLLRIANWGLNIPTLMVVFVISILAISAWRQKRTTEAQVEIQASPISKILLLSIIIFSICFVIRASGFMQALNIFVVFVCLLLLSMRMSDRDFLNFSFEDIFLGSGRSLFLLPFAPLILLIETQWSQLKFKGKTKTSSLFPLIRGLIIAIPIFIVFATLFASSDAIFGQFFKNLFSWDIDLNLDYFLGHAFGIALFSYFFAGLLRNTFLANDWRSLKEEQATAANFLQLGILELYLILGSLIVLFTSFLIVQFKYLFGGAERVLDTTLSYAEYGRSGFFELVTVAFFLNILLLVLLWLTKKTSQAQNSFKLLASIIIILLFGVILSGYKRLSLYIDAYGLTTDRFYSMAFIFFLGMLMLFFLCKLFIKKSPSLASGYIILGMLAVFNLVLLNPDMQIAKVNLERSMNSSKKLDTDYLDSYLSEDALPIIATYQQNYLKSHSELSEKLSYILWFKTDSLMFHHSWRSWNYGKWKARQVLKTIPEDVFAPINGEDAMDSWVVPKDTRSE